MIVAIQDEQRSRRNIVALITITEELKTLTGGWIFNLSNSESDLLACKLSIALPDLVHVEGSDLSNERELRSSRSGTRPPCKNPTFSDSRGLYGAGGVSTLPKRKGGGAEEE
ncbi:hypothetical protein ACFX13_003351 [Malus domestica]